MPCAELNIPAQAALNGLLDPADTLYPIGGVSAEIGRDASGHSEAAYVPGPIRFPRSQATDYADGHHGCQLRF
jgi:hypothetical protein